MLYRILLSCAGILSVPAIQAQIPNHAAFAITSEKTGTFSWTEVKLVDLRSGQLVKTIYDSKGEYRMYSARSGKEIMLKGNGGTPEQVRAQPFSTFSAACAYDRKNQRLYYTPMFINELRYIDLSKKTPSIHYFDSENFSTNLDLKNEGSIITRMVIGANGEGYALNNDGTHFLKFTTGKKPTIEDLGQLNDHAENEVSIRERNTSWGGDLIADDRGGLLLISAFRSVFRIDVSSRTAKYLGKIEGLAEEFTTNGAVVDHKGRIVVSSANAINAYYAVDPKTWKAVPLEGAGAPVYNSSDLANGNLLSTEESDVAIMPLRESMRNPNVAVYPNPVRTNGFRVQFSSMEPGRYDVQLVDSKGSMLQQKTIQIASNKQVVSFDLKNRPAKGMYLVKVLNNTKKNLYVDKLFIE